MTIKKYIKTLIKDMNDIKKQDKTCCDCREYEILENVKNVLSQIVKNKKNEIKSSSR